MKRVPEKGRDTTAGGRATDPLRNDQLDGPGRVSHPFSRVPVTFPLPRVVACPSVGGPDSRCCAARRDGLGAVPVNLRSSMTGGGGSDGTLPGATGGSDRKETLKAPAGGIQSFSRPNGSPSPRAGHGPACELLGCAHALAEFVKHPQRGRLGLCWYHARRVEEIGGYPVGRGHA